MSENNCAVYVHVNLINGKKYVGITTMNPPEKRWQNGYGYYRNAHFTNAIKKYGWNNFAHFVLYENIPIKIAKNIEEILIQEHFTHDPRFGYNKTMGGELEIPTEEARQKMSEAKKCNNPMKRPEVVAKMVAKRSKPVVAINAKTGLPSLYFVSAASARRLGFNHRHIGDCCLGKRKTHKGYIWRYVEGGDNDDGDN